MKLLLESGADPNVVAGNGLTPLEFAEAAQAAGIAAVLERHVGPQESVSAPWPEM